jgi:hypothetical protein
MGEHGVRGRKADNGAREKHRFNAAEANSAQLGNLNDLLQKIDKMRPSFDPAPVRPQVNARQDYLVKTGFHKRPDFGKHMFRQRTSSRPAHMRDNAVRAAGVAPILQFDQRSSLAAGVRHRRQQAIKISGERRPDYFALRMISELVKDFGQTDPFGIADHQADSGDRSQSFRVALGIATGHDDARLRILAVQAADGLAHLLIGPVGDRAAIHDNEVGIPGALGFRHGVTA